MSHRLVGSEMCIRDSPQTGSCPPSFPPTDRLLPSLPPSFPPTDRLLPSLLPSLPQTGSCPPSLLPSHRQAPALPPSLPQTGSCSPFLLPSLPEMTEFLRLSSGHQACAANALPDKAHHGACCYTLGILTVKISPFLPISPDSYSKKPTHCT
jgi:hypothetical protein